MADDDSLEMIKAGVEGGVAGALESIRDFLAAVFGVPTRELSQLLGDRIRWRRWQTQLRMFVRAQSLLREHGIEPQAVSLTILVPLLDGVANETESEEGMTDRWAALLANAAAGKGESWVLPSYPEILAQLSPREAGMLDFFYELEWKRQSGENVVTLATPEIGNIHGQRVRSFAHDYDDLIQRFGRFDKIELCLQSLERLGLLRFAIEVGGFWRPVHVSMTPIGLYFVRSCRPESLSIQPNAEPESVQA